MPLPALPVGVAQVPPGQNADGSPAPLPEFKVFPKARFIESRTNEADTLRIKVSDTEDEQVFVLYFVDALDASWTHPQRVQEQARYFGVSGDQRGRRKARRATQYVDAAPQRAPFTVMTRWEQVPERSRFYALDARGAQAWELGLSGRPARAAGFCACGGRDDEPALGRPFA
jgi:hypothetical protein